MPDTPQTALNALLGAPEFGALEHLLRGTRSAVDALGVSGREASYTSALRSLLDPRGSHGAGKRPLELFLRVVAGLSQDPLALQAADIARLQLESSVVEVEVPIKVQGRSRRLDLVVRDLRSNILLVVETKIDSAEHSEQTTDYAVWAADQIVPLADGPPDRVRAKPLLAFLAPDGHLSPASPFVYVTLERYLAWLGEILPLLKDPADRTWVESVCEVLRRREDVSAPEVEKLVLALEERVPHAIARLRCFSRMERVHYRQTLEDHRATLDRLGIRDRRLPHAFRARVLAVLDRTLDRAFWHRAPRTGDGLVSAVLRPEAPRRHHVQILVRGLRTPSDAVRLEVGIHTCIGFAAHEVEAAKISSGEWHSRVMASLRSALEPSLRAPLVSRRSGFRTFSLLLSLPLRPARVLSLDEAVDAQLVAA